MIVTGVGKPAVPGVTVDGLAVCVSVTMIGSRRCFRRAESEAACADASEARASIISVVIAVKAAFVRRFILSSASMGGILSRARR
jgi:hypothetical protein